MCLRPFVIKDNSYRDQNVLLHDQLGKEDSKQMEDTHNFNDGSADMEPCTEMSMKNGELEIINSKIAEPCTRHTVQNFMNVLRPFVIKDNSYRVQYVLFHDQLGVEDSKQMEDTRYCSNGIAGGEVLKSGNPKISRIGRQKRKNNFSLFSPKEPIWLTIFGNDIKRFDFLFLYSKFAKPENSVKGPPTAATRLEIWHMFNTLVRTHQTLS